MSNKLSELYSGRTIQAQKLFQELEQKNVFFGETLFGVASLKRFRISSYKAMFWVNYQGNHTTTLTILTV